MAAARRNKSLSPREGERVLRAEKPIGEKYTTGEGGRGFAQARSLHRVRSFRIARASSVYYKRAIVFPRG